MGKRLWIGEALRLHFDEKLTRLAVSHHLKLSDWGCGRSPGLSGDK